MESRDIGFYYHYSRCWYLFMAPRRCKNACPHVCDVFFAEFPRNHNVLYDYLPSFCISNPKSLQGDTVRGCARSWCAGDHFHRNIQTWRRCHRHQGSRSRRHAEVSASRGLEGLDLIVLADEFKVRMRCVQRVPVFLGGQFRAVCVKNNTYPLPALTMQCLCIKPSSSVVK